MSQEALEAAKGDKGRIQSLESRIGELKVDLQRQSASRTKTEASSATASEQDKGKIRSLQRRIGALESLAQEVQTVEGETSNEEQGKIRRLQRRIGALESELQEKEAREIAANEQLQQQKWNNSKSPTSSWSST